MVAKALDSLATIGLKHGRQVLMTAQDISIIDQMFEFENVSGDYKKSADCLILHVFSDMQVMPELLQVMSVLETAKIVFIRYMLAAETLFARQDR